jgi:hypothetical protein
MTDLALWGSRLENVLTAARIEKAKRARAVLRHGGADPLDEFPAVPFFLDRDQ